MEFCKFANLVRQQLPHPVKKKALGCSAVVLDSTDFGLVSRPRLFWTDIQWDPPTTTPCQWQTVEVVQVPEDSAGPHRRGLHGGAGLGDGWIPAPSQSGGSYHGASMLHNTGTHFRRQICTKTHERIDPESKTRWLQDNRTYAPWHYAETAMATSADGNLVTLPITVKEQLHGLPKNFTDAEGVTNRSRHRMIANGWHIGVIKFLMLLLVQPSTAQIVASPRQSTLQWVLEQVHGLPPCIGPGLWEPKPNCIPPAQGEMEHWDRSHQAVHPILQRAHLSPGLEQAVQLCKAWAHDLHRIRHGVVADIADLIFDRMEDTGLVGST